jgi:hypothetical protein
MGGRIRRLIPPKEEFSLLYVEKNFSQAKLAKHYSSTKNTIRDWILIHQLPLRSKGGGNNRKYSIKEGDIQNLVNAKHTYSEISKILKINVRSVKVYAKKHGVVRFKSIPEYQRYKARVYHLSNKIYRLNESNINPYKYKRTRCGVEGGYQLDHVVGIRECFDLGFSVEQCADLINLQLIPWTENLQKRTRRRYHG